MYQIEKQLTILQITQGSYKAIQMALIAAPHDVRQTVVGHWRSGRRPRAGVIDQSAAAARPIILFSFLWGGA